MENKNPFFTIITACFNSEKTIKNTVESVLNQIFTNFEYILIDGKSTDKTVEIIKSFEVQFQEKGISYKWISEKDTGIYNAFNKGIKLSSGKWISFLGSDDEYLKESIEVYQKEILKNTLEVDFVYSNIKMNDKIIHSKKWIWRKFKRKMNIVHVGGFHRKEYFNKYGFFDETFEIAGDYELLLRAKNQLKTHQVNKVTVLMGGDGISNNQVKKVYKETTKAKIKTANVNVLLAEFDCFIWMLKLSIKNKKNALVR